LFRVAAILGLKVTVLFDGALAPEAAGEQVPPLHLLAEPHAFPCHELSPGSTTLRRGLVELAEQIAGPTRGKTARQEKR